MLKLADVIEVSSGLTGKLFGNNSKLTLVTV